MDSGEILTGLRELVRARNTGDLGPSQAAKDIATLEAAITEIEGSAALQRAEMKRLDVKPGDVVIMRLPKDMGDPRPVAQSLERLVRDLDFRLVVLVGDCEVANPRSPRAHLAAAGVTEEALDVLRRRVQLLKNAGVMDGMSDPTRTDHVVWMLARDLGPLVGV